MTQKAQVLDYMQRFGSITPLEALADLGIMRLASRISDLKKIGFNIGTTNEKGINRFGKTTHYAKYYLIKENTANESLDI